MICFLRCSLIAEDIRLEKYVRACKESNLSYIALTWDRLNVNNIAEHEISYKRYAPYLRKWKNVPAKFLWQFYQIRKLIKYRKQYKVIHACDFDTILPAFVLKIFFRKKVIYDIYDSVMNDRKDFLGMGIRALDHACIKNADLFILPDKKRKKQIGLSDQDFKDFLEIENVPIYKNLNISKVVTPNFEKISLSYVGVFDYNRGLEDLLEVVEANDFLYLDIAGAGALQKLVENKAKSCSRITFYGRVPYDEGLNIMANSDYIIGMYYKAHSNHIYAAPNKYFESLFLAKPLITTSGTIVGDKTEKYGTGYAIDEGYNSIQNLFWKLINDKDLTFYLDIVSKASGLWKASYQAYFESQLKGKYIDKIKELIMYE